MMLPDQTPEQKMLHLQYQLLCKEFADLFSQKNEMLTYEEHYLTAIYLNAIGQLQHQKFCLRTEIKILVQRIQLMQAYINQNIYPDKTAVEKKIAKQFDEYLKKIAFESEQLKQAKKFLTDSSFLPPHITQKIKEVYVLIVKKLHPDVNPNCTEHEKDLLLKAQAAYDMANLDMLNAILLSIDLKTAAPEMSFDNLKEKVEKLSGNVDKIKSQISELEAKFPFSFREKLADERWIAGEQQSLNVDIELLTTEKKKYTEYLLLMDEWKPQVLTP
jgi:hypothetical protein